MLLHGIKSTVAENIRRLRQSEKISAAVLADKIGVSQSTVSDWECGKKMPRSASIEKLAEFFGVNKSDLLYHPGDARDAGAHDLLDLEQLLTSQARLVFAGRILNVEEKALAFRLLRAALGGDDLD